MKCTAKTLHFPAYFLIIGSRAILDQNVSHLIPPRMTWGAGTLPMNSWTNNRWNYILLALVVLVLLNCPNIYDYKKLTETLRQQHPQKQSSSHSVLKTNSTIGQ